MRSANMRAALGALLHGNREYGTDDGVGSITRDAEVRLADAPDSSAEPVREANSTAYAVAATIASGTERDAARLRHPLEVVAQVFGHPHLERDLSGLVVVVGQVWGQSGVGIHVFVHLDTAAGELSTATLCIGYALQLRIYSQDHQGRNTQLSPIYRRGGESQEDREKPVAK